MSTPEPKEPNKSRETDDIGLDPETDAILDKAIAWLEENWPDDKCPVCQSTKWFVRPPMLLNPLVPPWEGAVYPVIPIACQTCGVIRWLDPLLTNIMERKEPTDEAKP